MSDDTPAPAPPQPTATLPQVSLTFLTVTGRRRTMAFDADASVRRVKELVWNGWPAEWADERPPAPAFLRILYLGKMLQDDDTLSGLRIPAEGPPTIVHLSIRPSTAPAVDDADAKKPGGAAARGAPGDDDTAGCCSCVIC